MATSGAWSDKWERSTVEASVTGVVGYPATRYPDGQGRVLGGAILGPRACIRGPVQTPLRCTGPSPSPFNAWVLLGAIDVIDLTLD